MFDPKDWTYGFEIEWGDVPRNIEIPEHLGSWEASETDILNMREPYAFVAADPLGLSPPVGGEINTKPTKTWQEQVDRVFEIRDYFREKGFEPTVCMSTHAHVHIHIPGLADDITALKRLSQYVYDNQMDTVEGVYGYYDDPGMKGAAKGAKMYLKYDGGRLMPEYINSNIQSLANDFDDFIRLHACGKDGVSRGRPFRYAINMYSLKHTQTVEFRCFRNTLDRDELESIYSFVEQFMTGALTTGESVSSILKRNDDLIFPEYKWDKEQWNSLVETRWDKSRGKKSRCFVKI